jgi:hydroxypyruvate reductase
MPQPIDLHQAAREIFDSALRAVDPREAVRHALSVEGSFLKIGETDFAIATQEISVIAIGKAAPAMALGLSDILGDRLTRGVITAPPLLAGQYFDPNQWLVFAGGHPLPNEQSLAAAQATFSLLQRAEDKRGLVIFLVSGGGSAMIEWPRNEKITLDDLREANRQLVSCGAHIAEINAVRRAFSAVKGGGLSARAPRANRITLIISDTNPGDEASVASGPTLEPPADAPNANEVVNASRLKSSLPVSILQAVRQHETGQLEQTKDNRHYVLLNNQTAIRTAAEKALAIGFRVEVAADIREQPIGEGCDLLLSRLKLLFERNSQSQAPVCLISGGEFSCPVQGDGIGGRNLETVLRCAIRLEQEGANSSRLTLALSAGTDGIDGNSPAAGAIADETTIARGRSSGLDARKFLGNSDAFSFFQKLGSTIITGPTGTNVRDVRILLARS